MKFVDEVKIHVRSGSGGNGCLSFRREKYVPRGGPDGGDGGDGGDVIFVADLSKTTLVDLSFQRHYRATKGTHGSGKGKHGRKGRDAVIHVPVGTLIKDFETGEVLEDLTETGQRFTALRGGKGGKGNARFATSTNQAPRKTTGGEPGAERWLQVELKIMAEVGLVGFPNAGKSTMISKLTRAHPKIAPYPFTTLTPHLGTVDADEFKTFVVADIPGIIEGAAQGAGLGHRFLRHVERTGILVHIVDLSPQTGRDPLDDYNAMNLELGRYNPALLLKPQIVAANKIDVSGAQERWDSLQHGLPGGVPAFAVSALTGEGLTELKDAVRDLLDRLESER